MILICDESNANEIIESLMSINSLPINEDFLYKVYM